MKSMKSNRIVAILATISLLVGSLAVGGVLTASAVSEGWTADTSGNGQYKTYDRFTQLSTMVGDKVSLIQGKPAYGSNFNTDNDSVYDWYDETGTKYDGGLFGKAGGATDGLTAASRDDCATTEEIFRGNNATTSRYFYYDLGAVYNISDFVVASSRAGDTSIVLKHVRIHVATEWGETKTFETHQGAPTTGFTKIYENWGDTTAVYNYHIQPLDGNTVSGQYVCFELRCPQNISGEFPIAVSELAVYGTKAVEEEKPVLATYTHFARYTDDLTTVVAGDSLIKGMIPYGNPYSGKDLWESTNETGCPIAKLTDGKAGTKTSNDWTQIAGDVTGTNSRFLYFDLGATYNISDFIVASAQHIGGHALLRNVRIYVAETDNDMVTSVTEGVADGYTMVYENWGYAAEPTTNASWASSIGNAGIGNYHIVPGEGQTIVGRYVCFELDYSTYQTTVSASDTTIRIGELAVYGEKVDAVKSLGGQVSSYVNNNTVAKLRLGFNVAVTGVTRNESYEGDYTAAKVTVNGTAYDIAIDEETGLPIIGALVARGGDGQQVSEDLVVGIENDQVQDVHAKKIYDVNDDSITFTALITNVPSDYFDEQIIGRAYVGYMDGDTIHYVYSNLLSRSVSDVKDNTDMQ